MQTRPAAAGDELELPDDEWARNWEEKVELLEGKGTLPLLTAARASSKRAATIAKRKREETTLADLVALAASTSKVDESQPCATERAAALARRVRAKVAAAEGPPTSSFTTGCGDCACTVAQ